MAWFNKGGSPRVMLAGHADEIAMTVNFITKEGFIHVRRVGGVDPAITKAQRITIHSRQGPVRGVVGNVAPHMMRLEGEPKPPKIHDLFIDIGAPSRDEAEKLIRVGDPVTLNDEFELLRNNLAIARAFDNRIGTFAVIETLRLLTESRRKPASRRNDQYELGRPILGGVGAARYNQANDGAKRINTPTSEASNWARVSAAHREGILSTLIKKTTPVSKV